MLKRYFFKKNIFFTAKKITMRKMFDKKNLFTLAKKIQCEDIF